MPLVSTTINGMDTDDVLANLVWRQIRYLRQRRDFEPAIRRAWVRLYYQRECLDHMKVFWKTKLEDRYVALG